METTEFLRFKKPIFDELSKDRQINWCKLVIEYFTKLLEELQQD